MQTEKKRHLHKQQLIAYNEPELHIKLKNEAELLASANKRTNCLVRGKRLFGLAVLVWTISVWAVLFWPIRSDRFGHGTFPLRHFCT